MVSEIAEPVSPDLIEQELISKFWVRNFRGIDIYCFTASQAPNTTNEIGRIREIEFRAEGGGTGKPIDLDTFDQEEPQYSQIIGWDPVNKEIVGMYRLQCLGGALDEQKQQLSSPTAKLFQFSSTFLNEKASETIELGRSVVNRSAKKAILGLAAVWAGIGALVSENHGIKFLFGKFTTYPDYPRPVRSALYRFLHIHCPDNQNLITPKDELNQNFYMDDCPEETFLGTSFEKDYETLELIAKQNNVTLPPLVISYLNLSSTMKVFGTALNKNFGNVLETAMMITVADINEKNRKRFIESYESINPRVFDSV